MIGYTMIAFAAAGGLSAFIIGKVIMYTGRIMLFLFGEFLIVYQLNINKFI